ncbi:MAG: DUF2442 domain-containing protein [Deltaproteobacteria bacterium]|nr:DUF2442 domain-containing protein [Deltaproteobacteria bacterium]MBI3296006.1 DUF2442 domain-containing protein [Deltaproteobacteria bacterium]
MKSARRGKGTSEVEVQGVSKFGVWIYVQGREYFLSYKEYPWFEDAKVSEIMNVRLINSHHLEWPDLDIDLETESLEDPSKYPLKYKAG